MDNMLFKTRNEVGLIPNLGGQNIFFLIFLGITYPELLSVELKLEFLIATLFDITCQWHLNPNKVGLTPKFFKDKISCWQISFFCPFQVSTIFCVLFTSNLSWFQDCSRHPGQIVALNVWPQSFWKEMNLVNQILYCLLRRGVDSKQVGKPTC